MGEGYDVKLGDLEWDFVPVFGDGKITARLRQLTVEEYDGCINMTSAQTIDRPKMVSLGLLEIKGCSVNGKAIKTAEQLLMAPKALMPLFVETWLEIQQASEVTEEESKNS